MIKIDLPENIVDMGQRLFYEYNSLNDLMKTVLTSNESINKETYDFFMKDFKKASYAWEVFKEEISKSYRPNEGNYVKFEIDFYNEEVIFYEE